MQRGLLVSGLVIAAFSFAGSIGSGFPLAEQTKLRPARPTGGSSVWTEKVRVAPKAKPNRRRVKPRPPSVRLLTLEWWVEQRQNGGLAKMVNPRSTFFSEDQLRLVVKTNQNGYLYIIHQTGDSDGEIKFPTSRINRGENYVTANRAFRVPAYCEEYLKLGKDAYDCWFEMDATPGSENFTVIFSRDMITSLPNKAIEAGGIVSRNVIEDLKRSSVSESDIKSTSKPNAKPQQGGGAGQYVTWATNTNVRDNEELILTIALNHRPRE